jgi:3-ketosteroid 9alpha-monooxygenase subunit A
VRFANPIGEQVQITRFENNFTGVSLVTAITEGVGFGFLQCVSATPIDGETFRQVSRMYVRDMGSEEANAAIGKPFGDNTAYETEKDFRVLNYKKHLARPRLCAGDGPIMKWRQYQEAFYG